MSRRRRWPIGVVLVVAALLLVLAALLTVQLRSVRLKALIEHEVHSATGLVMQIDGDLKWRVWPVLGLSMGPARVMEADTPLARWGALEMTAHWRPLLHGEQRFDSLKLNGLEVTLHRGADGAIHWPTLARAGGPDGAARPEGQARTVTIASIELADAALRVDGSADAGALSVGDLRFQSGVEFDTATDTLRLRNAALRATAHAAPLPAAGIPVLFSSPSLTLRRAPLQLETTALDGRIAGLQIALRLAGAADLATPAASGTLQLGARSVRAVAHNLGVDLPPTRDPRAFGAMQLDCAWRADADGIVFDPLHAQMDGDTYKGNARAPFAAGQPLRFALAGGRLDMDRYLRPKDQPGKPFELPVAWLRALRVEGEVTLQEAQLAGATMHGVRLRAIDKAPAAAGAPAAGARP